MNDDASVPPPPGVDIEEHRHEKNSCLTADEDRDHRDYKSLSRLTASYEDRDFRSFDKETPYEDGGYDSRLLRDVRHRIRFSDYLDRKHLGSRYERKGYRNSNCERDNPRDREINAHRERGYPFEEIPHSTILVKGMEPHITEEDIRNEIIGHSLYPKDVSIIRRKNTGESRGFAYVEFQMLSDAVRWKELTKGVLHFGTVRATLHYYVPRDAPNGERPLLKADWTCIRCGVNNFRKRDSCFKCNTPKAETVNIGGEGCKELNPWVSHSTSTTLLLRNLDILTSEERVLSMLRKITALPIKNLKVARDEVTGMSRGFAFVELNSVSEATQLHDLLLSMAGSFYVDGRQVTVTYSPGLDGAAPAQSVMFSDSAIQRQQAQDSEPRGRNQAQAPDYQQYLSPDASTYQFDESSGYYYDSATGFYYDPNSRYYYDSRNSLYLYWDAEKSTYLSVPATTTPSSQAGDQNSVISSPPIITPDHPSPNAGTVIAAKKEKGPQDKVRIAKKVVKDMEKWAKTLNQKKENAKLANEYNKSTAVVAKPTDEYDKTTAVVAKLANECDKNAAIVSRSRETDSEADAEPSDEAASEVQKAEESQLIDWAKLACLLCKRQFPSKEVLSKHLQLSDLHKQNISMLCLAKLTPKQLKRESGYRDRAKERREKFGQPDVPPPSKMKNRYMKDRQEPACEELAEPIGSNNIGNKMLKAMGWTEGQGLGKSGQGMSGIIEVQRRVKSAGLGMKGASYGATASESYKEAVRKAMQVRYNELT